MPDITGRYLKDCSFQCFPLVFELKEVDSILTRESRIVREDWELFRNLDLMMNARSTLMMLPSQPTNSIPHIWAWLLSTRLKWALCVEQVMTDLEPSMESFADKMEICSLFESDISLSRSWFPPMMNRVIFESMLWVESSALKLWNCQANFNRTKLTICWYDVMYLTQYHTKLETHKEQQWRNYNCH